MVDRVVPEMEKWVREQVELGLSLLVYYLMIFEGFAFFFGGLRTRTLTQCQCAYRTDTVSVRPTLKPHISGALPLSETLKIIHFCNIFCKFYVNV